MRGAARPGGRIQRGRRRPTSQVSDAMNMSILERRAEPRTQAFVPVTLRPHEADAETPAHLLDLSCGGAGILAAAYSAPRVGEYVDLKFEPPSGDGATEAVARAETGIVVNAAAPDSGVCRLSVRFVQHSRLEDGLLSPRDVLSGYRKQLGSAEHGRPARSWGLTTGLCPAN